MPPSTWCAAVAHPMRKRGGRRREVTACWITYKPDAGCGLLWRSDPLTEVRARRDSDARCEASSACGGVAALARPTVGPRGRPRSNHPGRGPVRLCALATTGAARTGAAPGAGADGAAHRLRLQ